MSTQERRVFISHSHADKAIAEQLDACLRNLGVHTWLDKWEILPGDSLVQKIFEEGLKDCAAFLILLSPESVASNWVRHELDIAMVGRITGSTRIIPIIVRPCTIPTALRALLYLDISVGGLDGTARDIANAVFQRYERPPVKEPPRALDISVSGLTEPAAKIAILMSGSLDSQSGRPAGYDGRGLSEAVGLTPEEVNDAVEELESQGLVTAAKYLGTSPYNFGIVEPTYQLGHQLRGLNVLPYDAEQDVLAVAAAVGALRSADGASLQGRTKLSPARINNAVAYLDDNGLARVLRALGTAPFNFMVVEATGALRRFLAEHAR